METWKKVGLVLSIGIVITVIVIVVFTPPNPVVTQQWAGPYYTGSSCGGCAFDATGVGQLGAVITPQYSGNVTVTFSGTITSGNTGSLELLGWMGTGSAPGQGAQLQSPNWSNSASASGPNAYQLINVTTGMASYNFNISYDLTGLPKGVPVWLDVGVKSKTGALGMVTNIQFSATEAACLIC